MFSIFRGFPRGLPPGRPGDPGLFGPGSMAWRVNGEMVMLLGGPRALLMQIAHPSVAAGVAEHSDFPRKPYERLWRTLDSMLTIAFGDGEQSRAAAERVTAIHHRVRGHTPGGARYDALDPGLLLWVHATLVDSALAVYRRFVGPLDRGDAERYYEEMKRQAVALEVPDAVLPATLEEFEAYVARTARALEVTPQARELARDILYPPLPAVLRPVGTAVRLVTAGLLPPALRTEYRLAWNRWKDRTMQAGGVSMRMLLSVSPANVRVWPHARSAVRRTASGTRPT